MRSGIKTWCDLHKRNADSLIKPSCGCRLCKELPKNHPINFSTILQECGAEAEGGEAKRWVWGCGGQRTSFLHTLWAEVPLLRGGKDHVEVGAGKQGTGRGGGEKQTKCFNSCPFSLHLFCPRIWFPSEGVGFPGAPGSAQQGLFTLEKQSLFPCL